MTMYLHLVISIAVCLYMLNDVGYAATITIDPSSSKVRGPYKTSVTCNTTSLEQHLLFFKQIVLSSSEGDISGIHYEGIVWPKTHTKKKVSGALKPNQTCYLKAEIANINKPDWYTCTFTGYAPSSGKSFKFSEHALFSVHWGGTGWEGLNNSLQQSIDVVNTRCKNIESRMARQRMDLEQVEETTTDHIYRFQNASSNLFRISSSLDRRLWNIEDQIEERMFLVQSKAGDTVDTSGAPLKFSDVVINEGYKESSGVFEIPISGYYFFQYSMIVRHGGRLTLGLKKNNLEIVDKVAGAAERKTTQMVDGSAILLLNKSDNVSVCVLYSHGPQSFFSLRKIPNQFSGYLLKPVIQPDHSIIDYKPNTPWSFFTL